MQLFVVLGDLGPSAPFDCSTELKSHFLPKISYGP